MIFKAVYNKAIIYVEASSERMAKRILKRNYGFTCGIIEVNLMKYDKKHLAYAKEHERGLYGRTTSNTD